MQTKPFQVFMIAICCLAASLSVNTGYSEEISQPMDSAFIAGAYEIHPLFAAVQLLVRQGYPVQAIIEGAQRSGHPDAAITSALHRSDLPVETVILETMLSHMRPANVLKSLQDSGVDPRSVLMLLVVGGHDINRITAVCQYLLNQGLTKAELMDILVSVESDQPTIIAVTSRFNIPPAIVVQAYEKYQGVPGLDTQAEATGEPRHFGHVYTRYTLPVSSLIDIGIERIHDVRDGEPRSPSRP